MKRYSDNRVSEDKKRQASVRKVLFAVNTKQSAVNYRLQVSKEMRKAGLA